MFGVGVGVPIPSLSDLCLRFGPIGMAAGGMFGALCGGVPALGVPLEAAQPAGPDTYAMFYLYSH